MWRTSFGVIIKLGLLTFYLPFTELKKVKSGSLLGKRDILAGQVTFKADLTEGFSQVILQHNHNYTLDKQEMALDKPNVRAACPKDKLEFIFFLSSASKAQPWALSFFFFV